MSAIRIASVSSVHEWSHIRVFTKVARSLAGDGCAVSIFALDRAAAGAGSFSRDGVDVALLPGADIDNRFARALKGGSRVIGAVASSRPDIAILYDPELIPWIPYLRLRGIRVVFDAQEDFVAQIASRRWASGWKRMPVTVLARLLRLLLNISATHVVASTETIAERHPPARTTVINNYPLTGELVPASGTPLSGRGPRAVYLGGMTSYRGIVPLIEALPLTRHVEEVDIVGEFFEDGLQETVTALPGWKRVAYHGHCDRERVAQILGRARVGIVTYLPYPNHVNAKPTKMFEYLAAGLVIVHSDFPLWNAMVGAHGVSHACDPADPASIARALDAMVTDPGLDEKSRDAQRIVGDGCNWETEARRLYRLFAGLAAKP